MNIFERITVYRFDIDGGNIDFLQPFMSLFLNKIIKATPLYPSDLAGNILSRADLRFENKFPHSS